MNLFRSNLAFKALKAARQSKIYWFKSFSYSEIDIVAGSVLGKTLTKKLVLADLPST
jgi:hypothetical protein